MSFCVIYQTQALDLYARAGVTAIAAQAYRCAGLILARRRGALREAHLSKRERECVALAAHGVDDRGIARALDIAPITVRRHFEQGRRRLGAKTREHAVYRALATGQIQ